MDKINKVGTGEYVFENGTFRQVLEGDLLIQEFDQVLLKYYEALTHECEELIKLGKKRSEITRMKLQLQEQLRKIGTKKQKYFFNKKESGLRVKLLEKFKNANCLHGGLADGFKSHFLQLDDLIQLKHGFEVEAEHSDNPVIQREISLDHIVEYFNYYIPYLRDMEIEMEKVGLKKFIHGTKSYKAEPIPITEILTTHYVAPELMEDFVTNINKIKHEKGNRRIQAILVSQTKGTVMIFYGFNFFKIQSLLNKFDPNDVKEILVCEDFQMEIMGIDEFLNIIRIGKKGILNLPNVVENSEFTVEFGSQKGGRDIKPFNSFKEFKNEWLKNQMNVEDVVNYVETLLKKDLNDPSFEKLIKEADKEELEIINDYFEDLERKYDARLLFINDFPNKINVFRDITVDNPRKFIENLKKGKYAEGYKGLGVYWSYDEHSTDTYWGEKTETITIKAIIDKNKVDWKETIIQNLSYGEEEAEIYIAKGTELKVIEIIILDEHFDEKERVPINLKLSALIETVEFGTQKGDRDLTRVFPDECVSEEGKEIVGNTVKQVRREKGQEMYLGFQVKDIDNNGLSHKRELKQIIEQIDEDYLSGTISIEKALERLNGYRTAIKKSKKGEFINSEKKEEALKLITDTEAEWKKTQTIQRKYKKAKGFKNTIKPKKRKKGKKKKASKKSKRKK